MLNSWALSIRSVIPYPTLEYEKSDMGHRGLHKLGCQSFQRVIFNDIPNFEGRRGAKGHIGT